MQPPPSIRALSTADDLIRITQLVHSAYAPHAADGLRYWGTHQSVADTARRFAAGFGFVAEAEGRYLGTITVRKPQPESPVLCYRDPDSWSIAQFAVDPAFKGSGIGKALHEAAVAFAVEKGARTMVLDTAAPATGLIAMYRAWGYEVIGEHSWQPHTNYVSILMRCHLLPGVPRDGVPHDGGGLQPG